MEDTLDLRVDATCCLCHHVQFWCACFYCEEKICRACATDSRHQCVQCHRVSVCVQCQRLFDNQPRCYSCLSTFFRDKQRQLYQHDINNGSFIQHLYPYTSFCYKKQHFKCLYCASVWPPSVMVYHTETDSNACYWCFMKQKHYYRCSCGTSIADLLIDRWKEQYDPLVEGPLLRYCDVCLASPFRQKYAWHKYRDPVFILCAASHFSVHLPSDLWRCIFAWMT